MKPECVQTRDMENAEVPQQEISSGVSHASSVLHINVRMFRFCFLYCKTVEERVLYNNTNNNNNSNNEKNNNNKNKI